MDSRERVIVMLAGLIPALIMTGCANWRKDCSTFQGRKPYTLVTRDDAMFWFPISNYGGNWKCDPARGGLNYSWRVEVHYNSKVYDIGLTEWGCKKPISGVLGIEELIYKECQTNIWIHKGIDTKSIVEGEVSVALLNKGVLIMVKAPWLIKELRQFKPDSVIFKTQGKHQRCRKERVPLVFEPNS